MRHFLCIGILALFALINANRAFADDLDILETLQHDSRAFGIYAVQVHSSSRKREVISYSLFEGSKPFDENFVLGATEQSGNLSIKLHYREHIILTENGKPNFTELLTYNLQKRLFFLWPEFEKYQLEIDIYLVPSDVGVRKEIRETIENNKLKVSFYFRESVFSNTLDKMTFVATVSHESYHLFSNLFSGKAPRKSRKKHLIRQKHRILDEASASLFGTCLSLDTLGKATITNDVFVDVNGRYGTLTDTGLKKIINTKSRIPSTMQSAIGKAIFHTIWATESKGALNITQDTDTASRILDICSDQHFGNPENLENVINGYANDELDAPEINEADRQNSIETGDSHP
jgi:hypothetical protein